MDLVNDPGWGAASMDFYLGSDGSWNVQNFANSGHDSGQTLAHLQNCLYSVAQTKGINYWITDRIVFHQGGNDYIHHLLLILFMPWKYPDVTNGALNNIERIISMFQRRNKQMIIVGNYPALAYSTKYNAPVEWSFVGTGQYAPGTYIPLQIGPTGNAAQKAQLDQMVAGFKNVVGADLNYLKSRLQGVDILTRNLQWFSDRLVGNAGSSLSAYFTWLLYGGKLTTAISLGMLQMETGIPEMVDRRRAHGADIEYLPVWSAFQLDTEPWVARPNLLRDVVHPNPMGFLLWGSLVGDRIRAKGWNSASGGVVDPTLAPPPDDSNTSGLGENSSRPSDPNPSGTDLLVLCYLFGYCR